MAVPAPATIGGAGRGAMVGVPSFTTARSGLAKARTHGRITEEHGGGSGPPAPGPAAASRVPRSDIPDRTMINGLLALLAGAVLPGGPNEPPPYEFPPVEKLPDQEGMPDPFRMHDGSRVATRGDWARQRHYLKAMLAHYQYGHMPPRPRKLDVKQTSSRAVFDGKATEIRLTVTIRRGGGRVSLRVGLIRPAGAGPFPVVIKNDRGLFDRPEDKRSRKSFLTEQAAVGEAVGRGYVICKYIRTDLADDERGKRSRGVFPLYPEYDWGVIAAWAWGYQIVIDALSPLGFADMDKIVVTGHSRGGKTALCGAIYDERIAIAAPNSSGTGGTGSLRYFEKGQRPQTIAAHVGRHDHWWTPRFLTFANREAKLPFDAHFAKALIAPRGLVNPHALQDYWANPYGTQLTHQGARVVFDWLGVGGHIGIHWRPGGHAQGAEDWRALIDFAEQYFFQKDVQRKFNVLPYPDAKVPMTWKAPAAPPAGTHLTFPERTDGP